MHTPCECTDYRWYIHHAKKIVSPEIISNFLTRIHFNTSHNLQFFHCDTDEEILPEQVTDKFDEESIIFETSLAHLLEQNGKAKSKKNCSKQTRSLPMTSGLFASFWHFDVSYSWFLLNCTSSVRTPVISYETFLHRLCELQH